MSVLFFFSRRRPVLTAVLLLVLAQLCLVEICLAADTATSTVYRPADPLNQAAFDHYYNLDYDAAIQDFEKILSHHPNDAFAVNHLLSAVQVRELYRMGAMNTGDYSNDNFIGTTHRPADPAQKERIKQLVKQAEKLEEATLARDPGDVDALYARGVTRGQFALYTALIERAWFSALRNAVGARQDHEQVLELDPGYTDAKLVVGAHNYVMGNLSLTVRIAVAMVGLTGSKEKGLQYLYDAYYGNGETSVDAGIVLMVFCAASTATVRLCRSPLRLVHAFRATIFCRSNRRTCCGRPARATKPSNNIVRSGRTGAMENMAACITKSRRSDWATFCAARKNTRLRLQLTNW